MGTTCSPFRTLSPRHKKILLIVTMAAMLMEEEGAEDVAVNAHIVRIVAVNMSKIKQMQRARECCVFSDSTKGKQNKLSDCITLNTDKRSRNVCSRFKMKVKVFSHMVLSQNMNGMG